MVRAARGGQGVGMLDYILRSDPLSRAIFAEAFDAYFLVDDDGRIVDENAAARALDRFQLPRFLSSDAPAAKGFRGELTLRAQAVAELRASGRVLSLRGKTLGSDRHLVQVTDVTDVRAIEDELAQLRRLDSLGRVAARVVHDFNNVVQPIVALASLLEDAAEPGTRPAAYAGELVSAAERASRLVRHLLALLRDDPPRPERVDANEVVAGMTPLLQRLLGSSAELATELDPDAGAVRVDRDQLERVLLNLVANAGEAMPEGGRVIVSTVGDGQELSLRVRDTGRGMDGATRARILEGSFSTKGPGRGTGLSSAQAFVLAHGGDLAIDTAPQRGTTIVLRLPRSTEPEKTQSSPPRSAVRGGDETVLVVDADAPVRRVLRLCLEDKGYRVLEAASVEQTLQVEREHRGPIDLVLVDVTLTVQSGAAAAAALVSKRPSARVIFMSTADVTTPFPAPLLRKSFTPRKLAEVVRATLDSVSRS